MTHSTMRAATRFLLPVCSLCFFFCCTPARITRTTYFPAAAAIAQNLPDKENVWVFILAGQSNMAGRGQVGAMDTVTHNRILSINKQGQLLYAKEPLHFYEPSMAGLDCGMSFAKTLLGYIPDNISVLLIPTAVGGSSITQWLGDSTHRQVKLLSNFHDKVQLAKNYGQIKAVLWHQGESDAHPARIPKYRQRLDSLFNKFRMAAGNDQLPIYMGELGSYARNANDWKMLNVEIRNHAVSDTNSFVIATGDLKHKGDTVHFNAAGQRKMGQRMALAFVQTQHNLPLNRKGYRVQKSRR